MWLPQVLSATAFLFSVAVFVHAEAAKSECENKEKSKALLDLAKDAINKAKLNLPKCDGDNATLTINSTCGKEVTSAVYIDVALQLIKEAKDNYPECDLSIIEFPKENTEDPDTTAITEVVTEEITEVVTEETTTEETTETEEETTSEETTTEEITTTEETKITDEPSTVTEETTTEETTVTEETTTEETTVTEETTTDETTVTEEPTTTEFIPPYPVDCKKALNDDPYGQSGMYTIWMNGPSGNKSMEVYCDMDTDNGGWVVIQRRGRRDQEDFSKDWESYKNGFGDPERDFWIGNDNIVGLLRQGKHELRVDLKDHKGEKRYAHYTDFQVEGEENDYRLHIGGYSGNAGDSFSYHDGQKFTTKDRQNDHTTSTPCAEQKHGGWWFYDCADYNANGLLLLGLKGPKGKDQRCLYYYKWKKYECLYFSEIKIRRIE